MRRIVMIGLLAGLGPAAALANPYSEFPAPEAYPLQRSVLTPQRVIIVPYEQPFAVRVYSTPPQQPFHNVPPYAVVTPY